MRRRLLVAAATLSATLWVVAPAAAQDAGAGPPALVVGVYTPRIYFPDSLARGRFAEQLASALEARLGQPVRGRGIAAAGEFGRQLADGALDFAVVDAQVHIERGGLRPLAQATKGGEARRPMVLVVGGGVKGRNIGELQGRTLAGVKTGGRDDRFVVNYLLQRQVDSDYFKSGRSARDAQGALSLVKLGRADAAFTFADSTAGLTPVFRSRPAPLPVFVQARAGLDGGLVDRVRDAVVGLSVSTPAFDAFTGYAADSHKGLRAALASDTRRAVQKTVFASPEPVRPKVRSQLAPGGEAPVVQPSEVRAITVPELPEDAF
jgi:hypothetical protein